MRELCIKLILTLFAIYLLYFLLIFCLLIREIRDFSLSLMCLHQKSVPVQTRTLQRHKHHKHSFNHHKHTIWRPVAAFSSSCSITFLSLAKRCITSCVLNNMSLDSCFSAALCAVTSSILDLKLLNAM